MVEGVQQGPVLVGLEKRPTLAKIHQNLQLPPRQVFGNMIIYIDICCIWVWDRGGGSKLHCLSNEQPIF